MRLRTVSVSFLPLSGVAIVAAAACGPIGGSAGAGAIVSEEGGTSSGSMQPTGADGGVLMAPDGYHVEGNQVLDANGKTHLFRGMDRPSLEWSAGGANLSPADYQNMASLWNANVVRIPLNQDFWLNDPTNTNYSSGYASLVAEQVMWAEAAGLDVILDLHWSDQGSYNPSCLSTSGGNCQQCMADQHSILFWQQVAALYKDDGHVLFELYNEPHSVAWGVWLNGGTSGGCTTNGGSDFQVAGMQQLYDAVRGTGANNLVVIGGLNWAYDLSGVPSNRVQGYNIVYNSHPYASKCGSTCSTGNFQSAFGFLAATDPVMCTEFGDSDCTPGFYDTFTSYAQANGIHWTAWAYFVAGCTFPALISDWDGTPMQGSGTTVQTALMMSGTGPRMVVAEAGAAEAGAMESGVTESGAMSMADASGGDAGL